MFVCMYVCTYLCNVCTPSMMMYVCGNGFTAAAVVRSGRSEDLVDGSSRDAVVGLVQHVLVSEQSQ